MGQEFKTFLKRLREQRGLSLVKLAQRAQVSPSTLSYWEAGTRSPRNVELQLVLEALEASDEEKQEAYTLLGVRRDSHSAPSETEILADEMRADRWDCRSALTRIAVYTAKA